MFHDDPDKFVPVYYPIFLGAVTYSPPDTVICEFAICNLTQIDDNVFNGKIVTVYDIVFRLD